MADDLNNWKTQLKKGYLELCILLVIQRAGKVYGFDLLSRLSDLGLGTKEGTMYPLLNRMTADGVLRAEWNTEGAKGHPRKFYSLTRSGGKALSDMKLEFEQMYKLYESIADSKKKGEL